ncbi:MAG: FtsX-like permease family protein, partial [Lachnospiraceae bacterium]|nr:FtsX-like permease family protein [Lachnospiraceae bacterium]
MLNKIALRNARRLWKDYLNYFLTLCVITALMFSFHSLLFSKDIYEMIHYGNNGELSTAGMMLITFMILSTAVILVILAWLIHYMTRFIMEKRSREFAIYLISGMQKEQIAVLYRKENFYLGIGALFAGLLLGSGLKQVLFFVFYKSIGRNYEFENPGFQENLSAF